MSNILQATPFMHVDDIEAALAFFVDVLGFQIPYRETGYAYIRREGAAFRLLERDCPRHGPPERTFRYYIDVRDVDALYAELKPSLDGLPPGDVHGPADKAYGQRELIVLAPDGDLIAFGMPTPRAPFADVAEP